MKQTAIRIVCLLSALLLVATGALAGVPVNKEGTPIVEEKTNLSVFVGYHALHGADWDSKLFTIEAEKMTNVHIDWILVPQSSQAEKKNLLLASGDMPDVFMGALSVSDLLTYGSQGALVALDEYLDYAPSFSALIAEQPDIYEAVVTPEGKVYSFPKVSTNPNHRTSSKFYFFRDWLDQVGMEAPSTIAEYYEVLKAFKGVDFNGNGEADEWPLANFSVNTLMGSYGLGTRGAQAHPNEDMDPETGALRFIPGAGGYKQMLQFLNQLYTEGLIDPECFSASSTTVMGKIANNQVGAFMNINSSWAGNDRGNWTGAKAALAGPEGYQINAAVIPKVQTVPAYMVTAACKNVEMAVRWGDFWYADPGATLYWLGVEGESFYLDENGNGRLTEWYTNNPDGLSLSEAKAKNFISDYANHPIIREERFGYDTDDGTPEAIEASQNVWPYIPETIWPIFIYTIEENERISVLTTDLNTYVNDMRAQFIAGKVSFDQWDAYLATLDSLGVQEYLSIIQGVIDRNGFQ